MAKLTNLEKLKELDIEPSTMPKKLKDRWLKALRSGKYTQTTEALYDKHTQGFCCLGVLQHCLTGGVEFSGKKPQVAPTMKWLESWGIKFNDVECKVVWEDKDTYLSSLNDKGMSFKQIAKVIDAQVIGV